MRLNKKLNLPALHKMGVDIFVGHEIGFFGDVEIEAPTFCASQLRVDTFLRIGAFGSLNANTEIGHSAIGRYCSIAQGSYIGGDRHPTDWLSTSRLFYVDNFRNFGKVFNGKKLKAAQFHETGPITRIGHDVLIANNCVIGRGVTIGHGAIVAAGAVVVSDVPPYAIVGGNPAKVLRMRFSDAIIEKLLALEWWNYNLIEAPSVNFQKIENFIAEFSEIKQKIEPFHGFCLSRKTIEQFAN